MTEPTKSRGLSRAAGAAAAMEQAAEERARRQKAARVAVAAEEVEPVVMVTCRVLPKGSGLISMGQHIAGVGEANYERGETFEAAEDIAAELEDRGYVEIIAPAAEQA